MLRFDIPPVDANIVRWEAFLICTLCILALFVSPWFLVILPVQGLVKGFFGHHKCLAHIVWKKVFAAGGWTGKKENIGAKMFASKILLVASSAALTLFLFDMPQWQIPCVALIIFSFLEWAFSFCAACQVYNIWYKYFPPK